LKINMSLVPVVEGLQALSGELKISHCNSHDTVLNF
jgi:hypothetical protein